MRLALALVLALASIARADGGSPQTLQIHVAADRPDSLYVVTNYGLIISHDGGCTFDWVCEPNVGYGGNYIPQFEVARDGAIFATSFGGLRISRDGGCSFSTVLAPAQFVASVAIAPANGDVWATTATGGAENDVFVSRDGGATFAPGGLASTTIRWESVRVAPGDPERVYAAGIDDAGTAQLRRRDAGGWTELPATGIDVGSPAALRIAAIDPTDPGVVFVVSQGALASGTGDRLYRSRDAGVTFEAVYEQYGFIRDVLALDAQTVIVTSMVFEGPALVGGEPVISTDGGATFAPMAGAPRLACVTTGIDGALLGCGPNWEPDFMAVARRDGETWTKLFRFVELAGPLACPAGTGGAEICERLWPDVDFILKTTGPVCGPLAVDGAPQLPKPPGTPPDSCCGVAAGPSSLAWAIALTWLLRRGASGARSRGATRARRR